MFIIVTRSCFNALCVAQSNMLRRSVCANVPYGRPVIDQTRFKLIFIARTRGYTQIYSYKSVHYCESFSIRKWHETAKCCKNKRGKRLDGEGPGGVPHALVIDETNILIMRCLFDSCTDFNFRRDRHVFESMEKRLNPIVTSIDNNRCTKASNESSLITKNDISPL